MKPSLVITIIFAKLVRVGTGAIIWVSGRTGSGLAIRISSIQALCSTPNDKMWTNWSFEFLMLDDNLRSIANVNSWFLPRRYKKISAGSSKTLHLFMAKTQAERKLSMADISPNTSPVDNEVYVIARPESE